MPVPSVLSDATRSLPGRDIAMCLEYTLIYFVSSLGMYIILHSSVFIVNSIEHHYTRAVQIAQFTFMLVDTFWIFQMYSSYFFVLKKIFQVTGRIGSAEVDLQLSL